MKHVLVFAHVYADVLRFSRKYDIPIQCLRYVSAEHHLLGLKDVEYITVSGYMNNRAYHSEAFRISKRLGFIKKCTVDYNNLKDYLQ